MTDVAPEMKALIHEINNQLTALLMVLELAADPQAPPQEHGPAIEAALRHSRRLAESIRAMATVIDGESAATPYLTNGGVTGREQPE